MKLAVVGVHATLEAYKFDSGVGVGPTDCGVVCDLGAGWQVGHDEFDLGAAEAAAEELAMDKMVNHSALLRGAGLMVVVVFGAEGLAFGGILPGEDFGLGVDAGFQGIPRGAGLALGGAGPGAASRIGAIGFELS